MNNFLIENNDTTVIFNNAYNYFNKNFLDRQNQAKIKEKVIFTQGKKCNDKKELGFWHPASMGKEDAKFDMDPCTNDFTKLDCIYKCTLSHASNFLSNMNRVPCLYRANRIKYIKFIIDRFNKDELENISYWFYYDKSKSHWQFKIRYNDLMHDIDYIIILKVNCTDQLNFNPKFENIDSFYLITGFPIVMKSYKRRYEKEFTNYIESFLQ